MGRFIREQFIQEGVDVGGVVTDPECLTALVLLGIRDEDNSPLIFASNTSAASQPATTVAASTSLVSYTSPPP